MTNLDLRQLRYFVAVAEELHFGRAATHLHISQPPLSQQIAALEADLGVQLFLRNRHRVEITAAGSQLLKDARSVLQDAKQAAANARAAAAGQTGTLHIGLNYTAPLNIGLASILRRFSESYPHVGIELHENTSEKQMEGLHNRSLDLCFIWPSRDDPSQSLAFRPVSTDQLNIVLRDDHPLAHKRILKVDDLCAFPIFLTLRQTRTDFYDALTTACKQAGFSPDIRTHIIQMPFILNIIGTGSGIAFLPAFLDRIKPAGIVFRPCSILPKRACTLSLSLSYRAGDPSPLVQNFIKSISSGRRAL